MKKIASYFYRNFFDKELSFQYRLRSIFFIECFVLSMLSFTVNGLLAAANIGIVIQGFVNLFMLVVFFLPLKAKQRILPPLLLVAVYAYLPFLYFLYAGYDGSVLYFAAIGVFLLSFLYQGRTRIVLVILNIAVYVAAILLQTNIPDLVVPMAMPDARVTDLLAAIVFTLFGMFVLASYVNKAYEDERLRNIYLMSELEGKNVELKEHSIRDALTGTFNRRYLAEVTEQVLKRGEIEELTACFLMLDIDHFKTINDTYGHVYGDEILLKVTAAVQQQLRKHDVFARYGGEEFIVVLYPETLDDAVSIAERIRGAISKIILPDEKPVTVSLGVVQSSAGVSVDEIYHQVDEYLYLAKSNGRNRVEYPH